MLKNFLLAKSQGQKRRKFVSKAVKPVLFVILVLAVFLLAGQIALAAANIEPGLNVIASPLGLSTEDIRITIAKLIRIALGLLGIVTVVIIIYGGWLYMTSAGEADKVLKAKKVLINAVIGLIIILLSYAIASFIIRAILEATGVGPGGPVDYGGEGGALGNGIIESHYPVRNAIDVPRNTSIVVTFKLPMLASSIINTIDNVDYSNTDSVKIYQTADTTKVSVTAKAYKTVDLKTYVFKPVNLLGNPEQPVNYTVELTNLIKKADGKDAFGAFGGYKWSFEVSTRIDLTPPQVESVIPKPSLTVPRNMVIQINFNEAINPLTINGKVEVAGGGIMGVLAANTFDFITVKKGADFLAGQFNYGNQYRTVEFVSNDLCGQNSCGENVYCLPANATIDALVKAAALFEAGKPTADFPYTGIVDMADNSLDGNKDGVAKGPQAQSTYQPYDLNNPMVIENRGDDLTWRFQTNDVIDLVPPEIATDYIPEAGQLAVDPTLNFTIPFNKLMMATSLKPDRNYNEGYCECSTDNDCQPNTCDLAKGYCVGENKAMFNCTYGIPQIDCANNITCQEQHHITLDQPVEIPPRGYFISSENFSVGTPPQDYTSAYIIHYPNALAEDTNYGIIVGSGVRDITQNCYQPCAGPGCVKDPVPGGKPGEYKQGTPWSGQYPSCIMPPVAP
ncbi:MAG: hypothetical protein A2Y82_02990 [Candidatus Buchananbacteria bacterium RBG_13_36_9]|uniref:SbsA Ig-like domain-containing protein n=1 Tax=Candidatus Buchananbacteria bacterium RBG_13_36_9 TaxID=1797530 RepID=A0A1G1XTJ3_9BACT|nr:MAG: hypothetical protein A2Y82_02990 [Candidatus Buchananbacteria bacterium RBG_13_36_9]